MQVVATLQSCESFRAAVLLVSASHEYILNRHYINIGKDITALAF